MSKENISALGPTNTGKRTGSKKIQLWKWCNRFSIETFASENYDFVRKNLVKNVALITGEEKIIPENAKYFCIAESISRT